MVLGGLQDPFFGFGVSRDLPGTQLLSGYVRRTTELASERWLKQCARACRDPGKWVPFSSPLEA